MSLGRKQNISNDAWLEAVAAIEQTVPREELDALTASTVEDIRATTEGERTAYAWSGGKDSIVLAKVCEMAGVTDSMIGVCNLEYPVFMAWVEANRPEGCEVINTGQDLEWLSKHPEMLFPQDSKTAAQWFSIVQHRAQRLYFKAHKLDSIILGRRRADGNYVGRKSNIYTDVKGITRFSPLSDWSHEHILAFIHYHQLPLPPKQTVSDVTNTIFTACIGYLVTYAAKSATEKVSRNRHGLDADGNPIENNMEE